ncbi:MAG: hypothetical protein H7X88_08710, partial [Gloeobacteraceae cyanobacterium ES-bin-316]|nr:hypothetical protein [Ferruginibacter sp.]
MRLLFSTIIGLVMLCGQVCAQQSITGFKRFGRAEGVPNTSNNKIFESSDHFLWLGTSSGLYRFDGYQFSPYFSNNKDSTTISSNVIADIEEDRNGFLWVATFGRGVNKLNRKTGRWKRYLHPTKDENPFYWVFDLFKDKQGRLWLGTSGRGLLLYNEQADNFQQFIPDTTKSKVGVIRFENEVRSITADAKNPEILWLAGTDGLYRFDTKRSSFEHYENIKNGQAAWINNSFHCVYAQDNGNIWLGAWGGGLVHFNTRTGLFTNYPPAPQEYAKQNLSRNIIHSIAYCKDSLLYVTTANQGLLTFNIHTRLFTTISKTAEPDDAGVSTPFNGITHTSDGSTWICSEENIFQKNAVYQRMGAFQSFYQPAQKYVYKPGLSGLLYNKNTRQYWMSCNSGYGVYIYDSNFNYLKSIPIEGFAADRRLRDIVRDAAGNTWLLSKDFPYLYYYDATKDQFLNAAPKFNNPSFIASGLQEMAADGKGNVWLANKTELFKYDALTVQLKKIDLSTAVKGQKEWLWVKIRI